MAIQAVLGCLFGDEAKAKIVDVLAEDFDIIVRFQGGSNAGHTVIFGGNKYVMHLIPSGIFYPDKVCILGSGVVINPVELEAEMKSLTEQSIIFKDRFYIDERAAVVLPLHITLDKKGESLNSSHMIGTTQRGIGPCYADSASRTGIRMVDLADKVVLADRLKHLYASHSESISEYDLSLLVESLHCFYQNMQPHFINLPYSLDTWSLQGKNILFEGAQGTLLDVYFGTYPYVTSSHTIAGGIAASVGFSPKKIDDCLGVIKSYFTRVGEGPFPTELANETGEYIRKRGNEYGSTTGRPRRCGWFDAVAAKYSVMINGIESVALTLLDVLSGLETLKICVGYTISTGQKPVTTFPANTHVLEKVTPEYIELSGFTEDISTCRAWDDLPINAQKYVKKIEELLGVTVKIISVGPSREQTIFVS